MATNVDRLAEEALKLPVQSRAELAERLVQSLDAAELVEIDKLWAAEAKRRRDEVRSGVVEPIAGEEVSRRVRDIVKR